MQTCKVFSAVLTLEIDGVAANSLWFTPEEKIYGWLDVRRDRGSFLCEVTVVSQALELFVVYSR